MGISVITYNSFMHLQKAGLFSPNSCQASAVATIRLSRSTPDQPINIQTFVTSDCSSSSSCQSSRVPLTFCHERPVHRCLVAFAPLQAARIFYLISWMLLYKLVN